MADRDTHRGELTPDGTLIFLLTGGQAQHGQHPGQRNALLTGLYRSRMRLTAPAWR
jgi:hypothetical protein